MNPIPASELILNKDGSIYHLKLKPEHIADTILLVGDPDRVTMIVAHFDSVEYSVSNREFTTVTGLYRTKRISVISTGIGTDNIDIVLNELDALANIDFQTRCVKNELTQLNLIRIGTSGALQETIALDSFVMSTYALATDGLLQTYQNTSLSKSKIAKDFITHTKWPRERAEPMVIAGDKTLRALLDGPEVAQGITMTANGFYGPQGRVLPLPLACETLHEKIASFSYKDLKVTNLEMETAGIYGLSKLLGHRACSMNAILANRKLGIFSENPQKTIENMIAYVLEKTVLL